MRMEKANTANPRSSAFRYGDVPPVKGVIFSEAKHSELKVSVDMAPAG